MTDPKAIHDALESISRDAVSDRTNLWPKIRERMVAEHQAVQKTAAPRPRLSWNMAYAGLAVMLFVALMTGGGYLLIRAKLDPARQGHPAVGMVPEPSHAPTAEAASPVAVATQQVEQPLVPQPTATLAATLESLPTMVFNPTPFPVATQAPGPAIAMNPSPLPPLPIAPTMTPESAPAVVALAQADPTNLGVQTVNGITVRLEWAYLDEARLALQYTVTGLPVIENGDLGQAVYTGPITSDHPALDPAPNASGRSPQTLSGVYDNGSSGLAGYVTVTEVRDLPLKAEEGEMVGISIDISVGETPVPIWQTGSDGEPFLAQWVDLSKQAAFHYDIRLPYTPSVLKKSNQTVESNGVKMQLDWVKVSPSATEARICYNLPTKADWWPGDAVAQMDDSLPDPAYLAVIDPTTDPAKRCMRVFFATVNKQDAAKLALTIPRLVTPPDYANRFDAARKALAEKGIIIEQVTSDTGPEVHITRRPEGMRMQEARHLLLEAVRDSYAGAWTFSVPMR
jgi:hypothetical protein